MKLVIFLAIFSLVLFSCEKEPSPSENGLGGMNCPNYGENYPITNTDLIHMKYLVGTYWNYIDSVTMTNDSVYIESAEFDGVWNDCGGQVEKHFIIAKSATTLEESTYSVYPGGFSTGGTIGQSWGTQIFPNSGTNAEYLDSMFSYDQFYYDVYKTELNNYPATDESTTYFINKDFGILRIEKYSNGSLVSNKNLSGKTIVR